MSGKSALAKLDFTNKLCHHELLPVLLPVPPVVLGRKGDGKHRELRGRMGDHMRLSNTATGIHSVVVTLAYTGI